MDDNTQAEDTQTAQDQALGLGSDTTDETPNEDTSTLMSVESAIKMNMAKISRVKEDVKPVREMMKSFLEGDEDYMKATEAAKKASQKAKMDALKADLDEAQEALSSYLREYQRMTGLSEFEGEDGELRQIVSTVKLVRKTNLNK